MNLLKLSPLLPLLLLAVLAAELRREAIPAPAPVSAPEALTARVDFARQGLHERPVSRTELVERLVHAGAWSAAAVPELTAALDRRFGRASATASAASGVDPG